MESYFEVNSRFADIVIRSNVEADAPKLYFSKYMLYNASEYFAVMFTFNSNENIDDIKLNKSTKTITAVLKFIMGKINDECFAAVNLVELVDTAREYLLDELLAACEDYIIRNIKSIDIVTTINNFTVLPRVTIKLIEYINSDRQKLFDHVNSCDHSELNILIAFGLTYEFSTLVFFRNLRPNDVNINKVFLTETINNYSIKCVHYHGLNCLQNASSIIRGENIDLYRKAEKYIDRCTHRLLLIAQQKLHNSIKYVENK